MSEEEQRRIAEILERAADEIVDFGPGDVWYFPRGFGHGRDVPRRNVGQQGFVTRADNEVRTEEGLDATHLRLDVLGRAVIQHPLCVDAPEKGDPPSEVPCQGLGVHVPGHRLEGMKGIDTRLDETRDDPVDRRANGKDLPEPVAVILLEQLGQLCIDGGSLVFVNPDYEGDQLKTQAIRGRSCADQSAAGHLFELLVKQVRIALQPHGQLLTLGFRPGIYA